MAKLPHRLIVVPITSNWVLLLNDNTVAHTAITQHSHFSWSYILHNIYQHLQVAHIFPKQKSNYKPNGYPKTYVQKWNATRNHTFFFLAHRTSKATSCIWKYKLFAREEGIHPWLIDLCASKFFQTWVKLPKIQLFSWISAAKIQIWVRIGQWTMQYWHRF